MTLPHVACSSVTNPPDRRRTRARGAVVTTLTAFAGRRTHRAVCRRSTPGSSSGLLLVALSVLGGLRLAATPDHTVAVYAAARDLPADHVLIAGDLRTDPDPRLRRRCSTACVPATVGQAPARPGAAVPAGRGWPRRAPRRSAQVASRGPRDHRPDRTRARARWRARAGRPRRHPRELRQGHRDREDAHRRRRRARWSRSCMPTVCSGSAKVSSPR